MDEITISELENKSLYRSHNIVCSKKRVVIICNRCFSYGCFSGERLKAKEILDVAVGAAFRHRYTYSNGRFFCPACAAELVDFAINDYHAVAAACCYWGRNAIQDFDNEIVNLSCFVLPHSMEETRKQRIEYLKNIHNKEKFEKLIENLKLKNIKKAV